MVSTSSSSSPLILDLEVVDRFCDLAKLNNSDTNNTLKVLATLFVSRQGLLPARRNALAILGETGVISTTNTALILK